VYGGGGGGGVDVGIGMVAPAVEGVVALAVAFEGELLLEAGVTVLVTVTPPSVTVIVTVLPAPPVLPSPPSSVKTVLVSVFVSVIVVPSVERVLAGAHGPEHVFVIVLVLVESVAAAAAARWRVVVRENDGDGWGGMVAQCSGRKWRRIENPGAVAVADIYARAL
jgi:hypothetical protein